jgi:hypothetical protein
MTFLKILAVSAAAAALAAPAAALEVKEHAKVAATPDAAWHAIGDFCGIAAWHPAVAKCDLSQQDGATFRTLTLNGGGTIVEKLLHWDDAKRKYSYAIVSSPLPVTHYRSTLAVGADGRGAIFDWRGHFAAKGASDDKATQVIDGIYKGGLESLVKRLAE